MRRQRKRRNTLRYSALRAVHYGLEPVSAKDTDHYKVMREFCEDPAGFVEAVVEE